MSDEFTLTISDDRSAATVAGVFRLASPSAYVPVMKPLVDCIEAKPRAFRLDLAGVSFMNSSGVTALSRLVMSARQHDVALVCVVDDAVPWQGKTLSSLQRLYPKLELVRSGAAR